jgi:hypothetical protein
MRKDKDKDKDTQRWTVTSELNFFSLDLLTLIIFIVVLLLSPGCHRQLRCGCRGCLPAGMRRTR